MQFRPGNGGGSGGRFKIELVINDQKNVRLPIAKEQLKFLDSTATNFTVDVHIPDAYPPETREGGPVRAVGVGFSSMSLQ